MRQRSSSARWSWRILAGLVLLSALAQACGGSSSQGSGPSGNRVELRFPEVKGARLALLPAGCQQVVITVLPLGLTATATDTTVSMLLPAGGPYTFKGVLFCGNLQFASLPPDPQGIVPPSLGSIDLALIFGGVNVTLTVVAGPGVSVSGSGISCPGDCTQQFLAGTSVALTANPSTAVFTGGGCNNSAGSCNVTMNASKTVSANLPSVAPPPPPPAPANGTIRVVNTSCCDLFAKIFVQPADTQVGAEIGPVTSDTPGSASVPPGSYIVRITCNSRGNPISSQGPLTVTSGNTTVFSFSGSSLCG